MIIQLSDDLAAGEEVPVFEKIRELGYSVTDVRTDERRYLVCTGSKPFDIRSIGNMPQVRDVHFVADANQLVSREWKVGSSVVDLGDGITIGGEELSIMAGPCSIESEEQVETTVKFLLENNVRIMRGGVFKPRSSPYAFRGLGYEGLKMFHAVCRRNGVRIITEVMQADQIDPMLNYVDVFQVGARNAQNFTLLDALGKCGKPVLLKRGISGTVEEMLASAEYIFSGGNEQIILCERGIRTFERASRNTLDLNAVPILKKRSHLPVIVDPSHGIGIREHVADMALAGVMTGADGIIVEVHSVPEKAYSDGQQTLNFQEARKLFSNLRQAYELKRSFSN
jgi:3-deoxy-7-phosphoheptulonate synthase